MILVGQSAFSFLEKELENSRKIGIIFSFFYIKKELNILK